MASPLIDAEWEPCLLENRRNPEIEALARKKFGTVPTAIRYLASCPWLCRAELHLAYDDGLLVHLDLAIADVVGMTVSQENSCRYCYAMARALLWLLGMDENQIREVEHQLRESTGDPRTAAAVTFARRLARSDPLVHREDKEQLLAAGFTRDEMKEIAFVASFLVFANRAATIPAIPPYAEEKMVGALRYRPLRPIIRRMLQRTRVHGKPVPPPDVDSLPWGHLVSAYAGSPIAHAWKTVLEEAWAPGALPRRTKALLTAVVAKALDCDLSLDEARRVLDEEGVDSKIVDDALAHLSARGLEPPEDVLLPFARETVWYRPAPLQRSARRVRDQVTEEQFVEAIGILALANALCRLASAVVEDS